MALPADALSVARAGAGNLQRWLGTDLRYLGSNSFWLSAGQGASAFASFGLALILANLLSPSTYGTYKYALSVFGLLSVFTLSGMNTAVMVAVARGADGAFWPAFKTKVRWGLLAGLGSAAVAVYYLLRGANELGAAFLVGAALLPIMDSLTIYGSIFAGRAKFKASTWYGVATQAFIVACLAVAAVAGAGVLGLAVTYLAATTASRAICLVATLRREPLAPGKPDEETVRYGKHLSVSGLIGSLVGQADSLIVYHFLGPAALAIFALALAPVAPLKTLLKSVLNLAFPKFSQHSWEELRGSLLRKALRAVLLVLPGVAAVVVVLPYLYQLFFPQYLASAPYAQAYALTLLLFPEKLIGVALTAHGAQREIYIMNTTNALVRVSLFLVLVPLWGLWGAMVATVGQYLVALTLSLSLFIRYRPRGGAAGAVPT